MDRTEDSKRRTVWHWHGHDGWPLFWSAMKPLRLVCSALAAFNSCRSSPLRRAKVNAWHSRAPSPSGRFESSKSVKECRGELLPLLQRRFAEELPISNWGQTKEVPKPRGPEKGAESARAGSAMGLAANGCRETAIDQQTVKAAQRRALLVHGSGWQWGRPF